MKKLLTLLFFLMGTLDCFGQSTNIVSPLPANSLIPLLQQGDVGVKTTAQDIANLAVVNGINITKAIDYGAGSDNSPANSLIYANTTAQGVCTNTTLCQLNTLTIADNVDASASANGLYA